MKLIITRGTQKWTDFVWEEMDIQISDKKTQTISVYPLSECPEDAIIGRDLISCGEIANLMKIAYEAGKNGEELEIEELEDDE